MRELYSRKGPYNAFIRHPGNDAILNTYKYYVKSEKRVVLGDCFRLDAGFLFREDIWLSKILKALYA